MKNLYLNQTLSFNYWNSPTKFCSIHAFVQKSFSFVGCCYFPEILRVRLCKVEWKKLLRAVQKSHFGYERHITTAVWTPELMRQSHASREMFAEGFHHKRSQVSLIKNYLTDMVITLMYSFLCIVTWLSAEKWIFVFPQRLWGRSVLERLEMVIWRWSARHEPWMSEKQLCVSGAQREARKAAAKVWLTKHYERPREREATGEPEI